MRDILTARHLLLYTATILSRVSCSLAGIQIQRARSDASVRAGLLRILVRGASQLEAVAAVLCGFAFVRSASDGVEFGLGRRIHVRVHARGALDIVALLR